MTDEAMPVDSVGSGARREAGAGVAIRAALSQCCLPPVAAWRAAFVALAAMSDRKS